MQDTTITRDDPAPVSSPRRRRWPWITATLAVLAAIAVVIGTHLKSQQAAVAAEAGRLDASKISDDGVYVAGQDIQAGTWHTPGDGGQGGDNCYFAVLNSTDTSDIADNNNFDGLETVTVPAGKSFEISGGCPWYRTS